LPAVVHHGAVLQRHRNGPHPPTAVAYLWLAAEADDSEQGRRCPEASLRSVAREMVVDKKSEGSATRSLFSPVQSTPGAVRYKGQHIQAACGYFLKSANGDLGPQHSSADAPLLSDDVELAP